MPDSQNQGLVLKRLIGARFSLTGTLLVLGGVFMVLVSQQQWSDIYKAAFSGIGGALIGSGGSMFVDAWSKGETLIAIEESTQHILREIRQTVQRSTEHYRQFGVYDIHTPAHNHDYSPFMEDAKELTLVFNDMKTWLTNHKHLAVLRDRIRGKKPTRIYLMNPAEDNTLLAHIGAISQKIGPDGVNRQIDDVKSSVREITNGFSSEEMSALVLRGHYSFNTYTLVMSENECLVVYYPIAMRYNNGVIWHFERGKGADNMYGAFEVDVKQIERLTSYGSRFDLKPQAQV